ncbi:hypothetical protein, partial [Halomonas sp.]|uniref:hypothetical protein n=1 Tax=Halomonas sp. TaxID=1486246 RepID=UPI0035679807
RCCRRANCFDEAVVPPAPRKEGVFYVIGVACQPLIFPSPPPATCPVAGSVLYGFPRGRARPQ